MTSPYLGFAEREHGAFGEVGLASGWLMSFGIALHAAAAEHGVNSSAAYLESRFALREHLALRLRLSQLWERGSLFGGAADGSFSVDQAATTAIGLALEVRLNQHLQFIANADFGHTRVDSAASSLLQDFSAVRSSALGIGMLATDTWRRGDRAGLALLRPLRISAGDVALSVPIAIDAENRIRRRSSRIELAPQVEETDVEAYYQAPIGGRTAFSANFLLRHNPEHIRAGNEVTIMGSVLHRF